MSLSVRPGRYAIVFAATALVGGLVVTALERVTTWDVPTAFMTILPPMVAAMLEGARIGRETGAPLPKGAWLREGLVMTAVAFAIKLVLGSLIVMMMVRAGLVGPLPWGQMALLVALDLVATLAVNIFFLIMGVRNELRSGA